MSDVPDRHWADDPDRTRSSPAVRDSYAVIGPYRLVQQVGEGGMGQVWLAEQTGPVRRQVALKIIKAGMDSAQVIARFQAERQALAVMDHPCIAKVFDAGTTPQGRPFFAMEYVRGEPITAYCDRCRLSTNDRLRLFIHVCEGVQHAHQKGIIHRDLKASNVLVTVQDDHPVPKIIDFGVAKATTGHLSERTLYTELGVLVGTPEYMSPEQADLTALDIDTRTDVYSLGVLLYELITGALPFDAKTLREKGFEGIQRTIREVDPPRPSTRVTQLGDSSPTSARNRQSEPARLAGELKGDLDWITMHALEKDRTRRYGTASELAADIRRHLESLPVLAGPAKATYRIRKFVRRHQFGVAAAATLALLLSGFAATMLVQARRIALERDRANLEAETAKQVSDFLIGLFEVSQPGEAAANSITAREILDKGASQIERELGVRPEVRGAMMSTMGRAYLSLGLYKRGGELLSESLEVLRQRNDAASPEVAAGKILLAHALRKQGRPADAERLSTEAVAQLREHPGSPAATLAKGLVTRGSALRDLGKYAEAEASVRESLDLYRRNSGSPPVEVATALATLGSILYARADFPGAGAAFQEALDLDRRALGASHPMALSDLSNLASVWTSQGKLEQAETAYRELLTLRRERLGPDHPDMATTFNNLGAVLFFERKYAEATDAYRQADAIARRALGDSHPSVARYEKNLGQALAAQGNYADAETVLTQAAAIERAALGDTHPSLALTLVYLSDAVRRAGRFSEAERIAREALAIDSTHLQPDHPRRREAEGALGMALAKQRRWADAEPMLVDYAVALEAKKGVEGDVGEVARQIVDMYVAWEQPAKAAEWRKRLGRSAGQK